MLSRSFIYFIVYFILKPSYSYAAIDSTEAFIFVSIVFLLPPLLLLGFYFFRNNPTKYLKLNAIFLVSSVTLYLIIIIIVFNNERRSEIVDLLGAASFFGLNVFSLSTIISAIHLTVSKKKIRMKPISYVGMVMIAIGAFGDDIFYINNVFIACGLIVLILVGLALVFKGREEY